MKLYYAFGGGLGHISRANAIINTLGLELDDFIFISNSKHASLVFEKNKIIHIPQEFYQKPIELQKTIQSIISDNNITELYIDSFPYGIIGELDCLKSGSICLFYIARILNWEKYSPLVGQQKLYFEKTFIVEDLPDEQAEFVNQNSKAVLDLKLIYPGKLITENAIGIINSFKKPPWLIVHSEPFDELIILYQHALEISELERLEPEFLVISQVDEMLNYDKVRQISYFPATDFFPFAEKIFTACGFNSMHQTAPFFYKHHFIPFARKFDNQFLRAINRKPKMI